ncbi:MAG: PqqD family peptide modification chaperone [Saprospiraceae bacterium]|nr:PqqD family peptide modification chaperone [Saprospiraceae bacterium]
MNLLSTKYTVNSPHVVHDTIDGETILVNLKNGNYYSFDKLGVIIWDFIVSKNKLSALVQKVSLFYKKPLDEISEVLEVFITQLKNEELIVIDNSETPENQELDLSEIEKLSSEFAPPILNKYADMQDVLLLDPIHDTDEKGWPSGKDEFQ